MSDRDDVPRVRLTVAVPTFRRPGELRAGLPLILAQVADLVADRSTGTEADVLVIDNDPAASARGMVAELGAASAEVTVRYLHEPVPGISAARNCALDGSTGSDLLVFIDDDERPLDGWLRALYDTWRVTGATAVMGRVVSVFESDPEPWVAAGRFFERFTMPTGTPVEVVAAGNLLLDLRDVRRLGARFDADLGLSGGEDTLFSRQLARAGCRQVWCDESATTDQVPAERLSREWVLRRSWSHGNTIAVVSIRMAGGATGRLLMRVRGMLLGTGRIVLGGSRQAWGGLTGSMAHQARGCRTRYRGLGMMAGVFGSIYQEYARAADESS